MCASYEAPKNITCVNSYCDKIIAPEFSASQDGAAVDVEFNLYILPLLTRYVLIEYKKNNKNAKLKPHGIEYVSVYGHTNTEIVDFFFSSVSSDSRRVVLCKNLALVGFPLILCQSAGPEMQAALLLYADQGLGPMWSGDLVGNLGRIHFVNTTRPQVWSHLKKIQKTSSNSWFRVSMSLYAGTQESSSEAFGFGLFEQPFKINYGRQH